MPQRRASAAGQTPGSSSTLVHKSNGSVYGGSTASPHSNTQALPRTGNGTPNTPHQKVVSILVQRLKHKLPCNAGTTLTELEDDLVVHQTIDALVDLAGDSLDLIAYALTDQLQRLTQIESPYRVDILQSELFLLKVLSIAMASRLDRSEDARPDSSAEKWQQDSSFIPDSPSPSMRDSRGRHAFNDRMSTHSAKSENPPLVESSAKYVLSIMILFLRQTAPPAYRLMSAANLNFNASYHDFESVESQEGPNPVDHPHAIPKLSSKPKALYEFKDYGTRTGDSRSINSSSIQSLQSASYEKTSEVVSGSRLSLSSLIAKFSGKVIHYLSLSNWNVVFDRIRTKISELSNSSDNESPELTDLQLLMYCALDKGRLISSLQALSSLLVNMRRDAQVAICAPLRSAIWNWIESCPDEFNEVLVSHRRLDGAPERVFDLLYGLHETGDKGLVWPALTVLMCISSERTKSEYQMANLGPIPRYGSRKDRNFVDQIIRTMISQLKSSDVAMVCALDICRAASRIKPVGDREIPLVSVANDIAHEVKNCLNAAGPDRIPFWSSLEDIDVALLGDALVTIYRFLNPEESISIFLRCLEPTRSDAVKICVVKACITLVTEAHLMPWIQSPDKLREAICARVVVIYACSLMRRSETDEQGNIKKPALRPKGKRYTTETVSDRELLALACLALYRADVSWFLDSTHVDYEDTYAARAVEVWLSPSDISVKVSMHRTTRFAFETITRMSPDHPHWKHCASWMACAMPGTLAAVCINLLDARTDFKAQQLYISMAIEIMHLFTRPASPHLARVQTSVERIPAFLIAEIAFLVSLTSADRTVSAIACQCLRLLAVAERQANAPCDVPSIEERHKRHPLYDQLGADQKSVLGRVAHQKRIRKIMRLLTLPPAVHMAVWQECYFRWLTLNELAIRMSLENDDMHIQPTGDRSLTLEERQAQWHNLTLFMASFGNPILKEGGEIPSLSPSVRDEYLPDEMRVLRDPGSLITIFFTEVINLLISDSHQARKVAEETLGTELNPRLYSRILKELDSVLQSLTDVANIEWDTLSIFLESYLPIATILAENIKNAKEIHAIDMGDTLNKLATFIMRLKEGPGYRHKIKFCALCDTVYDPSAPVASRKDNPTRQGIADLIIEWATDPASVEPEYAQLQRELNFATLKAAVRLFDNLKLQAPEGLAEDDTSHFISRLYVRYTAFLQRMMDFGRSGMMRDFTVTDHVSSIHHHTPQPQDGDYNELVIAGLASLVSSNTEFGIKHCLPHAYLPEVERQTCFARVFARVLSQGVELSTREASANVSRQSKLCELIKGPDPSLALSICEVCPGNPDEMIEVLLEVFDTRSSLVNLLKAMVDREISRTENEADLFRSNSFYNVFMSSCARLYGYNYLRSLLIPLLKTIASLPPGHSFDIDPLTAGQQAAAENQKIVELVASSFIDIITSSVPAFPPMFLEVCAHIVHKVVARWKNSKFAALGAFIFLRFINPCIVYPPRVDLPLGPEIHPGLKLVAKIVQNLANNLLFGKEAHMQTLNAFLQQKISLITTYLSLLTRYTPSGRLEEHEEWLETSYDETDTILLQRFFMDHVDKIGKELLSSPRILDDTDPDGETTSKSSWQAICSAIYESNVFTEIPKPTDATSEDHAPFRELMARYALRDVSSVQHLLTEIHAPKYERVVFVFSVAKIDVEVLDLELLLYYILQTLTSSRNLHRDFEIIFDWAYFSAASNVPLQWIKFGYEVIPRDIRERMKVCYFLTPNDLALRYMRKLAVLVDDGEFAAEYVIHSSVHELLSRFPAGTSIRPLAEAYMQEEEPREQFTDITMRLNRPMHVPVHLEIATSHLRIVTLRPVQYCRGKKAAEAIDIIPLADISDAYNVSTGQELNEFVIRKARHGNTLYFASPLREAIVKTIRTAKGNVKNVSRPFGERYSKLSNVVATLLHIGMVSIGSQNDELRLAAVDLLSAICIYLDFEGRPIAPAKSIFIPGHPGAFVIQLSEKLAPFAPHLTLDFIAAVAAMDKSTISQKINCLQYLSPWIKNLSLFMDPLHRLFEPSGTRFRDCIRTLIDLTIADCEVYAVLQKYIWSEIGKLESNVVNAVLDELMRAAVDGGMGSPRSEIIADIMTALTSINVRGRIFARIRKVLGKTCTKPTKDLAENSHWAEVVCLTRLAMVANYHPRNIVHAQLYVPEVAHLVTLIAGTGEVLARQTVYGIIVNLLNDIYLARSGEVACLEVKALLDECVEPSVLKSFGLCKACQGNEFEVYDPNSDKERIDLLENLTSFLCRIMAAVSNSSGLLNVWRARWMSLITSSAFQFSPAIQTRAFVSMGMLAGQEVDDDLLYQMLVAFKTALSQFNEKDTLAMISMLRCMYRVVQALPKHSRYLPQLFWLAVALLETGYVMIYTEAIQLLQATLDRMEKDKEFEGKGVAFTLMEARAPLEGVSIQLDHLLSLSFHTSFHFALAAIIFKGVRHATLHRQAGDALRSLLRIAVQDCGEVARHNNPRPREPICQEVLGYFIALIPLCTSPVPYKELLVEAKVHSSWASEDLLPSAVDHDEAITVPIKLLGINDRQTALLAISFISAMLQTAQGDDKETETLYGILAELAEHYPETIGITFDSFQEKLRDAFANSSRPTIISYLSSIFKVATQEHKGLRGQSSASTLGTVEESSETMSKRHMVELDQIDMTGLASPLQFVSSTHYRQVTKMINFISELVMKIIE